VDTAGGLRVGPRSAGARPGPACYRRGGEEPTLTDANVVLGYIRPGPLADGDVVVDAELARRSVADRIAGPLGLDLPAAAFGIHQIANATTMRALRQVSTERGRDPREFTLVAFGGAGPIHAAGLAGELAISRVVVPPLPGLFSAMGLLFSGIEHHAVRSCQLSRQDLSAEALEAVRAELRADVLDTFAEEGHAAHEVAVRYTADVRFRGQTSEINVPLASGSWGPAELAALQEAFADEHERLYGHRSDPDNPVEVIALRAVGRAEVPDSSDRLRPGAAVAGESGDRSAWFGPSWGSIDTPVCRREDLGHGERGPLLIDEYDTTIVVPPGMRARVDDRLNVHIELERSS
jgi:N-methylhydantoinase A